MTEIQTTVEALQALVGQRLTEVKETAGGILLVFSDGTVLFWRS